MVCDLCVLRASHEEEDGSFGRVALSRDLLLSSFFFLKEMRSLAFEVQTYSSYRQRHTLTDSGVDIACEATRTVRGMYGQRGEERRLAYVPHVYCAAKLARLLVTRSPDLSACFVRQRLQEVSLP
jgi:hypothetical protein